MLRCAHRCRVCLGSGQRGLFSPSEDCDAHETCQLAASGTSYYTTPWLCLTHHPSSLHLLLAPTPVHLLKFLKAREEMEIQAAGGHTIWFQLH